MDYLKLVKDEFKSYFPNYEEREEQEQMWDEVYDAMKHNKKIAIHAPTGTGKTFGYIVPAIALKLENPQFKVINATYTINLQEQLSLDMKIGVEIYEKLAKKLNKQQKKISFVSLFGNSNYFCEKTYRYNKDNGEFKALTIKKVEDALRLNIPKLKQSFGRIIEDKDWDKVKIETCSKKECPFNKDCQYYNEYQMIPKVDMVIANHALFFRRYFFVDEWEDFNFFVFDEAHKIEKSILESYTFTLSKETLVSWMDEGESIAKLVTVSDADILDWRDEFYHRHDAVNNFNRFLDKCFLFGNDEKAEFVQTFDIEKINTSMKEVKQIMFDLYHWQKTMLQKWFNVLIPKEAKDMQIFKDKCDAWKLKLVELQEFISLSNNKDKEGSVWFEIPRTKDEIFMKITPKQMNDIKTPFRTGTVLTSGTIAVNKSCSSLANRLVMDLESDVVLPSPFSLQDQTIAYVSSDLNPKDANSKDYTTRENYFSALEEEIYESCLLGEQKTFILFTSNSAMWSMFKRMNGRLRDMETFKNQPLEIWVQQKNNNKDVMKSFKNPNTRTILFGTLSYFEGIDLKRESLTQIILTKLPFSVPDHPIQKILEQNEGYTAWEAMVRFEQAFGRLIRTGYDYGSFHILDNRVAYMPQFLSLFHDEGIPVTQDKADVEAFFRRQSK